MQSLGSNSVAETLTQRECEVLQLLDEGLSDREIARKLVITVGTVKWYNRQIYNKLGVTSRSQAVSQARELRLLQPDFVEVSSKTILPKHNLPGETTTFIGRRRELAALKQLLQSTRLLTLIGAPGTGKTRLSLQLATQMLPDFSDGVYFVNLASLDDSALVALAIANTLGLEEVNNQAVVETLKDAMRDREMLLILDNFEHLLRAAPLVSELLSAAKRIKFLVTSRESLRLYGEQEYNVLPLELPELQVAAIESLRQNEAVILFVQRARAIKSDFAVTDENILDIAHICVRLEGLPLAIELAASRMKLYTPFALLQRLSNLFTALVGGSRDLPVRQQTLRQTIDWSFNLLNEGEKTLFSRLSIFASGCTLEAIQEVCCEQLPIDLVDGLESLINKSLVHQREVKDEPRFVMLETVREYARERLEASGETQQLREHHARYYTAVAKRVELAVKGINQTSALDNLDLANVPRTEAYKMEGINQASALDNLDLEHDNFRAVLQWSLTGNPEPGLRLIVALGYGWTMRGHWLEGLRWLQKLLEMGTQIDPSLHARALHTGSILSMQLGDDVQSEKMARDALKLARDAGEQAALAWSLHGLGLVTLRPEMPADAYAQITALFDEALSLFRLQDDGFGVVRCLTNLGEVARFAGDPERAASFYKESALLCSQLGDLACLSNNLISLGWGIYELNNYTQAESYFREALDIARKISHKIMIMCTLTGLASVAAMTHRLERAARLLGAIRFLQETHSLPLASVDRADYDRCVCALQDQMERPLFEKFLEAGRGLDLQQTIAYAAEGTALIDPL